IGDYPQTSGAVWRQVIDLSDLDKSLFQIAPGVSGNPASPYYDSTLADWQTGEYFSLSASEKQLQDDRALLTTLTPKNPDGL
ncbi:MAG: penicillin acylase family protein, partial [Pseudomonadota bacterium]